MLRLNRPIFVVALFTLLLATGGCLSAEALQNHSTDSPSQPAASGGPKPLKEAPAMAQIQLKSSAFSDGQPIPRKYTGDGQDLSPPLSWSGVPQEAKELALICDDPDAPTKEPWVHWVIYKIPVSVHSLPEGLPKSEKLANPPGALQGKNSWPSGQTIGYRGPAPPPGHGVHHYHFKLYALDTELQLPPGVDKKTLLEAMKGHIVAQGELIGTYQR